MPNSQTDIPVTALSDPSNNDGISERTAIVAGVSTGLVVLLVIIVSVIFVMKRHQRKKYAWVDQVTKGHRQQRSRAMLMDEDELPDEAAPYRATPEPTITSLGASLQNIRNSVRNSLRRPGVPNRGSFQLIKATPVSGYSDNTRSTSYTHATTSSSPYAPNSAYQNAIDAGFARNLPEEFGSGSRSRSFTDSSYNDVFAPQVPFAESTGNLSVVGGLPATATSSSFKTPGASAGPVNRTRHSASESTSSLVSFVPVIKPRSSGRRPSVLISLSSSAASGSIFHEGVWPPPGDEANNSPTKSRPTSPTHSRTHSRRNLSTDTGYLVDPLVSSDDLSTLVDDIMGPSKAASHTRKASLATSPPSFSSPLRKG